MKHIILILIALCVGVFSGDVLAQQAVPVGGLQLNQEAQLMLEAAGKTVRRDFKSANELYTQVIGLDAGNIDAYLQRGIVRRQLGDAAGVAADGRQTVLLANAAMKAHPDDPNLYYKRGQGYRLLKQYEQAKKDINTGMDMGGSQNWQVDLQSIQFEERARE